MRLAVISLLIVLPLLCRAQVSPKNEQFHNDTMTRLRALSGVKEVRHLDVIEFINKSQGAVILMTLPGHPAHPAMVKHQAIEEDGQLAIKTTSSSGGDHVALKKWIDDMAAEQKSTVESKRKSASAVQESAPPPSTEGPP